jgi:hypothetical protein
MKKLMLISLIGFVGCMSQDNKNVTANNIMKNMYYFKDYNTDLCFAGKSYSGSRSFSFTIVPCNEEVEKTFGK